MTTPAKRTQNAFWEGETCEYCGGPIRGRTVQLTRRYRGQLALFRGVPAGVCRKCGTRYFAANVLKLMSDRLRRQEAPSDSINVPVYEFQKA